MRKFLPLFLLFLASVGIALLEASQAFKDTSGVISLAAASSELNGLEVNTGGCPVCQPSKCEALPPCNVGVVRDRCGCCDMCGLEEGHLCNKEPQRVQRANGGWASFWPLARGASGSGSDTQVDNAMLDLQNTDPIFYGYCGRQLSCLPREDVEENVPEIRKNVCHCMKKGLVCASNGMTLTHCQMDALTESSNGSIGMISAGPCKATPQILTIAESQVMPEGAKIALLCEVEGYPLPTVTWTFTSPNMRMKKKLPGDDEDISVSFRGGPQRLRISSYLQISDFKAERHEGEYQCFVDNDMGMDRRTVSLVSGPPGFNHNGAQMRVKPPLRQYLRV